MEDKSNLIKKGTKRCSTRLQKHAPTFIEINDRPTDPFAPSTDASSSKAIPLLSPLVLSPQALYAEITAQTQMLQNNGNIDSGVIKLIFSWVFPTREMKLIIIMLFLAICF
ncbi:hypothetical protein MtrunA17_Chr4g0032061 [Medicago truncatula]|uniref:Uncharacterized protein n=1 Tax=Medicago truncatula TaxID=3880 RepID=G7JCG5_MEDTR|nr:hypothetical protein MTR_4g064870 [Medicago truncatula]RHN61017.1 hypothetical protein MtrunA17_Chr4g0032061 [Medicago truncatula]